MERERLREWRRDVREICMCIREKRNKKRETVARDAYKNERNLLEKDTLIKYEVGEF
jgi:hypothetical protein